MNLKEWEKLSPEEQVRRFVEEPMIGPSIELGRPMTKAQEERGHQAMASAQLEEDAIVSTIDRLIAAAPETLSDAYAHTLHRLKQSFNSAVERAEQCQIKEMVSNLLLFEDAHGEIVDEMWHAVRRDVLQTSEALKYIDLLGLFERRTVPKAIKDILTESCGCKEA